ncbi:MAG: class I SAM-dependent methyltransferase [Myxococcales bacterium]|nr:class I SAM-dependent methyltransferase [Myxococcales bacterium]
MDAPSCIACTAPDARYWFTKRTDHGAYGIHRCQTCDTAFVWPRPSDDDIERYYHSGHYAADGELIRQNDDGADDDHGTYGRIEADKALAAERAYPNTTLDAARVASVCKELAPGSRFLDVGAGFGFFSRAAKDAGFDVTSLEPSPKRQAAFREIAGFEASRRFFDQGFISEHEGAFDLVLMSQVLEHVLHLDDTLEGFRRVLSTGGIVAIAVPHFRSTVSLAQGKDDMFIVPPEHLNFFTQKGLADLFGRHGFPTLRMETVSRFDPTRIATKLERLPVPGPAKLALPLASRLASSGLKASLRLSDAARRGMFLNGYFRKTA